MLVSALTIDAVLVAASLRERRDALASTEQKLRMTVDFVLGQAEETCAAVDRTLTGINEVLAVRGERGRSPDRALHQLLLRRHAMTPSLRWLAVLRNDGTLAEYTLAHPAPRLDLRQRPYFQAALAAGADLRIGRVDVSEFDGEAFVPVSRRAVDGTPSPGVVVGAIDPAVFVESIQRTGPPPGYVVRLYLADGHALACSEGEAACHSADFSRTPLFAQHLPQAARGAGEAFRLTVEAPGLGAYARSSHLPLVASVEAPRNVALAQWYESLGHYVLVGVGSNLALVMLSVFAAQAVQRQRDAMAALADANALLEQRVAERTSALTASEARARAFMNTAMDAIIVIDEKSRVIEFNPVAERMFGFRADEVLGGDLGRLMPAPTATMHQGEVAHSTVDNAVRPMGRGREVIARRKNGQQFPIEVTVGTSIEAGRKIHVGIVRDITERKAAERELQRLATTDGLTGVLNRRAFSERAQADFLLARRHARPLAVLAIDADHFKRINDANGHHAGDEVLRALTRAVAACLRDTDLFGRLGGEEFGLVLPETDSRGASELGQRLLAVVRNCRVRLDGGNEVTFTVSIGVAVIEPEDKGIEDLLRRADQRLYAAKQSGRDRLEA